MLFNESYILRCKNCNSIFSTQVGGLVNKSLSLTSSEHKDQFQVQEVLCTIKQNKASTKITGYDFSKHRSLTFLALNISQSKSSLMKKKIQQIQELLQQSSVQSSERLESVGKTNHGPPWNPSNITAVWYRASRAWSFGPHYAERQELLGQPSLFYLGLGTGRLWKTPRIQKHPPCGYWKSQENLSSRIIFIGWIKF